MSNETRTEWDFLRAPAKVDPISENVASTDYTEIQTPTPRPDQTLTTMANGAEMPRQADTDKQKSITDAIKQLKNVKIAVSHRSNADRLLLSKIDGLIDDLSNDTPFVVTAGGPGSRQKVYQEIMGSLSTKEQATLSALELSTTNNTAPQVTRDPNILAIANQISGNPKTESEKKARLSVIGMLENFKGTMERNKLRKTGHDLLQKVANERSRNQQDEKTGLAAMIWMNAFKVRVRSLINDGDPKSAYSKAKEMVEQSVKEKRLNPMMADTIMTDLFPNHKPEIQNPPKQPVAERKPATVPEAPANKPLRVDTKTILAPPREETDFTKKLQRETEIVTRAFERDTKTNIPATRRRAWEEAFREVVMLGKLNDTDVENTLNTILQKYPGSKDDKVMRQAFHEVIVQKKAEFQYMDDLTAKAEQSYLPTNDDPTAKDRFVNAYIIRDLTGQIINSKQGITDLQRGELAKLVETGIEDGSIQLYTPAFERATRDGEKVSQALPPVLVAKPEILAQLAGDKEAPRGITWEINTGVKTASPEQTQPTTINIIGIQNTGTEKDLNTPNDTLEHELTHVYYTQSRDLLKSKYENQVRLRLSPKMVDLFYKKDLTGPDRDNYKPDPSDQADRKYLTELAANFVAQGELSLPINMPADRRQKAQEFLEYCQNHSQGKTNLTRIKEAYKATKDEFTSPVEELLTLGTDMVHEIGLKDLGIDDFDPKNSKHQAALGLLRIYNTLWQVPTTNVGEEEHKFFRDHEFTLRKQILLMIREHTNDTPEGVLDLLQSIQQKAQESGDVQQFIDISKQLDITYDSVMQKLPTVIQDAYTNLEKNPSQNTQKEFLASLTHLDEKQVKLIERMTGFTDEHGVWQPATNWQFKVMGFLKFINNPPTDAERAGELSVSQEGQKKSGAKAGFRNYFDKKPGFGPWGAKNFAPSLLEAVPIAGPILQGLVDTINPKAKVYKHPKDKGAFGIIPWLNRSNLVELGLLQLPDEDILDTSDWLEGISTLFGIDLFRNPIIKDLRKRKIIPGGKDIYMPETLVQPSLPAYYTLTLDSIGMALTEAQISGSQKQLIYQAIGGISKGAQLEPDIQDWGDVDEYRMNGRLAKFTETIQQEFHQTQHWQDQWSSYLSQDAFITLDGNGNENEIAIHVDPDKIFTNPGDKNTEAYKEAKKAHDRYQVVSQGEIKKGTMTKQLMTDICETISVGLEPQDTKNTPYKEKQDKTKIPAHQYKRQQFEHLAKLMMTADLASKNNHGPGYTLENLANAIIAADKKMNSGGLYGDRFGDKENKRDAAHAFINNPTLTIALPGEDADGNFISQPIGEPIDVNIAKDFIAHYYLARLNTITHVGIWGMHKKRQYQDGNGGLVERDESVSIVPSEKADDGRDYWIGKRKLSDSEEGMMLAGDLVDPLKVMPPEKLELLNGTRGLEKKGSDGHKYTLSFEEDMSHDMVFGALYGAREGRQLAFMFTGKMRQIEAFRDMSRAKKELWEGTNNLDDTLRFLTLIYSVVSFLAPGLGLPFIPQLALGLLAWSMTVSPFINRSMAGWGQREKAANEAISTMMNQYAGLFYGLADDTKFHSPNELRHARSTYEAVKGVYKSVLVDLNKSGTTESNYIARKAKGLLANIL
jgi:hypothetical protein